MKILKYLLCLALLAGFISVPIGCSSNEATKIDASNYDDAADEEGEESEEDVVD